jgi:hypothetical protein
VACGDVRVFLILYTSFKACRIPEIDYLKITSLFIIFNLEMSLREEKCVGEYQT